MSRAKKIILWALALILLAGAIFVVPTIWGKPWSIEHFYARVFIQYALKHPMMLTSMRLLEPMGLRGHNAEVDDFSLEFQRALGQIEVGQLKILELRRRAMDRLGERFDLKQFHNVVLTNGALPLSLLEQQVELWIQEQEAAWL